MNKDGQQSASYSQAERSLGRLRWAGQGRWQQKSDCGGNERNEVRLSDAVLSPINFEPSYCGNTVEITGSDSPSHKIGKALNLFKIFILSSLFQIVMLFMNPVNSSLFFILLCWGFKQIVFGRNCTLVTLVSIWCWNKALKKQTHNYCCYLLCGGLCRPWTTTTTDTSETLPSMTSSCWNPPLWSHSLMTVVLCVMFEVLIILKRCKYLAHMVLCWPAFDTRHFCWTNTHSNTNEHVAWHLF